ncbi:unnamed protein product [Phyllotreta striolata]|uniref:Centrosomal protein kizuna n=1 Tax=Phyllotreta striolata TaxID=444603 RepID=A0A9N9TUK1_PHYSR|nr:unnamed protein product [Phyllotreta striolata]
MDLSVNSRMSEYYERFIELQEKLRKSEEERMKLELKFNEMMHKSREEEQVHYKRLRSQYKKFLDEDRKRQERNEKIVRTLERIETRIDALTTKTQRFKSLRREYHDYLHRVNNRQPSTDIQFDLPSKEKPFPDDEALRTDGRNLNDEKLEILDRYLESISSQRCKELVEKRRSENEQLEKLEILKDKLNDGFDSGKAQSIAEDIMNSIYNRHYKKDAFDELKLKYPYVSKNLPDNVNSNEEKGKVEENISKFNDDLVLHDAQFDNKIEEKRTYVEDTHEIGLVSNDNTNENEIDANEKSEKIDNSNSNDNKESISAITTETDEFVEIRKINQGDGTIPSNKHYEDDEIPEKQDISNHSDTIKVEEKLIDNSTKSINNEELDIQKQPDEQLINSPETNDSRIAEETNEQEQNQYNDDNPDELGQFVQYNEQGEAVQYDDNGQVIPANKPIQYEDNARIHYDQYDQPIQYDQNGQGYDQNGQPIQYDENNQAIQYDQNGQTIQYDENGQPIQYDENGQPIQYDENGQAIQYDENGQTIQYDENGQVIQYDENGQLIHTDKPISYDETDQIQYDENGQSIQYDQNGQPIQYDQNGQPIQYDQNGQPIQYDQNGQPIQYDQNGQPIQYDQNGQPIQYDQNGQPIQYDQNGQSIQYDENGQPIQYDENGQLIQYDYTGQQIQYDQDGQPIQYDENGQPLQYQQYNETEQPVQDYSNESKQSAGAEIEHFGEEVLPVTTEEPFDKNADDAEKQPERVNKILDMLDTDTESLQQNVSKVSNDSDFTVSS